MLKQKKSPRQRYILPHHNRPGVHASALYGLDYPADHLRLLTFTGDREDVTRGLLTFDRNVAGMPGDVNLWCGQKKAFYPTLANPRVVRVSFNCPISAGSAWSFDSSLGAFRGADGCAEALAASGTLGAAAGPCPAGKIWMSAITRYDSTTLDYVFSGAVTGTGETSGYWCTDEYGSTQYGTAVSQPAPDTIRVSFTNNIQAADAGAQGGIVAGFTGIVESADFLSPVTWRI